MTSDFAFEETPEPLELPFGPDGTYYWEPSVGTSDTGVAAVAYRSGGPTRGSSGALFYEVSPDPVRITIESFQSTTWIQPCLSMRSDGYFCIAWPKPEVQGFNLMLQLYGPDGVLIDEVGQTEGWVNNPDVEPPDSAQGSPAVAFDDSGNIVVTWVGPAPVGCIPVLRVWARRFSWGGGETDPIVPLSSQFMVDSWVDQGLYANPSGLDNANPTVALSLDTSNPGRFLVAWNVYLSGGVPEEIHGQYFEVDGNPLGCEFRVNQDTSTTGLCGSNMRRLSDSGQHTVAYGAQDQVVAVWVTFGEDPPCLGSPYSRRAYFTLLPGGYADMLDAQAPCLKGDVNRDGLVNGLDIQPFVDLLLGGASCRSLVTICPANADGDADLDLDDVPAFVDLLLDA